MSTPGPVTPADGTARLIAELLAAGEPESTGTIKLASHEARRQLQRFSVTSRDRYVLELVQAVVLKGAQKLVFTIDYDKVHLYCDGAPFTLDDLQQLDAAPFWRATTPGALARRHLERGLRMLSHDIATVYLESGDSTGGCWVERPRDEGGMPTPLAEGRLANRPYTTQIKLTRPRRPRLLKRLGFQRETAAEELMLRKHCAYARVDMTINGELLGRGTLAETVQTLPFAEDDIQGVVGWLASPGPIDRGERRPAAPPQPLAATALRLVTHGVWFATVHPKGLLPGCQGIVDCPQLRQDDSHEAVVLDAVYQRVIDVVLAVQIKRLVAGCGRVLKRPDAVGPAPLTAELDELRSLVMALLERLAPLGSLNVLRQWATEPDSADRPRSADPHLPSRVPGAGHLLDLPLLRSTQNKWVTLRELARDIDLYGSVAVHTALGGDPDPQRPLVLHVVTAAQAKQLGRLLGCPVADRALDFQRAERRRQHRAALQAQWQAAQRSAAAYVVRQPIHGIGVGGEVGVLTTVIPPEQLRLDPSLLVITWPKLSEYRQPASRLFLLRDGCLLAQRPLPLPLAELRIDLAAALTRSPSDTVVGDATLSAALTAALGTLWPLVQALTAAPLVPATAPLRARTLRGLLWLLLSASAQRQLRLAAGVEPAVADAETPLPIDRAMVWQHVRDLPLFEATAGLVSLNQLTAYASEYGCIPILVQPQVGKSPNSWYDPLAEYRQELFGAQYPASRWQAAYDKAPGIARRPAPPKLVVGIAYDEMGLAELLQAQLGDRYADMQPWLQQLRESPPAKAPSAVPKSASKLPVDERLRARVLAELQQIGPPNNVVLSSARLAKLQIAPLDSALAVTCDGGWLFINRGHPMMKYAVKHFESDPALVFFVAAAVHSTLAIWLDERSQETAFHCALSAHAFAVLCAAHPPTQEEPI